MRLFIILLLYAQNGIFQFKAPPQLLIGWPKFSWHLTKLTLKWKNQNQQILSFEWMLSSSLLLLHANKINIIKVSENVDNQN